MGNKSSAIGLRLQINRTWDSRWFAEGQDYGRLLLEDLRIRKHIMKILPQAAISKVVIERPATLCRISIYAARPCGETLERDRLADRGFGDDERIDVEVMVVFGIGDGRGEHLGDVMRHALGAELEDVERFLDLAAADQARNQVELLRRATDHRANGECFLVADPARVAKRFSVIDLPTDASWTISASTSRLWLFSALAIAEASTL